MSLIFMDCEAFGGSPRTGQLTEFGAVEFKTEQTFHGILWQSEPDPANPAIPRITSQAHDPKTVAISFGTWLKQFPGRPIFVSDNPAFDYQWINDLFWTQLGYNPFGYSARRISDFYAGLVGDFYKTQDWKRLRTVTHDHNPIHDSQGNLGAFKRLLNGERP